MGEKKIVQLTGQKASLVIFLLTVNIYCNGSMPFELVSSRPDMRVNNYNSINYQDGEVVWEINARESSYYFNEKRSIVKEIFMNYYEDGKRSAVIKAGEAIIHTDSKDIELIGNVDILSTAGNRLLTSKIKCDNRNKLLDTDEPIKIIRKNGDVIEGIGLKANYDLEDYEIKRKVIAITKNTGNDKKKKRKNR